MLCFDEFSVTDIADAMILSRLFSALFSERRRAGRHLQRAPDDLYRDGLNRPLFVPFIRILKRARADIRARCRQGLPAGEAERHAGLHHACRCRHRPPDGRGLAGDDPWHARRAPAEIVVKGRHVAGAARRRQGGAVFLCRSVRKAARRARLPGDRRPLRHDLHRPHTGACRRQAQRGQAPHPADRHALRPSASAWSPAPTRRRPRSMPARPARRSSSSSAPRRG